MRKTITITHKIASIALFIFVIGYFILSLSFMTNIHTLTVYQDYLKPETQDFYLVAKGFNDRIFILATALIVLYLIMILFKMPDRKLGIKGHIFTGVLIIASIVIFSINFVESSQLLKQFNGLDLTWYGDAFGISAEQLGYKKPNNFWLVVSTYLIVIANVMTIIFATTHVTKTVLENKKER